MFLICYFDILTDNRFYISCLTLFYWLRHPSYRVVGARLYQLSPVYVMQVIFITCTYSIVAPAKSVMQIVRFVAIYWTIKVKRWVVSMNLNEKKRGSQFLIRAPASRKHCEANEVLRWVTASRETEENLKWSCWSWRVNVHKWWKIGRRGVM